MKPTLKNVEAVYGFKNLKSGFKKFNGKSPIRKNHAINDIFAFLSPKYPKIFEAVYGFNVFQSWLQFCEATKQIFRKKNTKNA